MRFEDHLDREIQLSALRDRQRRSAAHERRRHREVRALTAKMALAVATIVWAIVIAVVVLAGALRGASEPTPALGYAGDPDPIEPLTAPCAAYTPQEEPIDAEPPEEPVYHDVALEPELQDLLRAACEEAEIPMELALAVVWKETRYRNLMGDGGKSYGYMQIQPRWHKDRMERLGVTDLMDPLSNFRVGCDFLAELLDRYPLANALAYYNTGKPTLNAYAESVMDYMEGL